MADTTVKLTKRVVDAAVVRPARYVIWDAELPGFGVRIEAGGTRSFILRYRPKGSGRSGTKRFVTIGRYGALTVEEARAQARMILGEVARGEDPAVRAVVARKAPTIAELGEAYLAQSVRPRLKPATARLYADYFGLHINPRLGRIKANALTRAEVMKLHREIGQEMPVTANRVLQVLSGAFAYAVQAGLLPESHPNPARGIAKFREQARERFLTSAELERLGAALIEAETTGIPWDEATIRRSKHLARPESRFTKLSPFAVAAIRLLVFTGCRLREILHLHWSEVDLERGMLHLSDSKTGRKSVVLNGAAIEVLESVSRVGAYVIAGDSPDRPRSDLKRPWMLVTRRAGLESLRIHDLRHTFASVGATQGLGLPIVGKLLGHAQASTTQRYAHLDADPLRRASNAIGDKIAKAMGGGSGSG